MTYRLEITSTVALRTIYLRNTRDLRKRLGFDPSNCAVLNVPPLLRELILSAVGLSVLYANVPRHRRLVELIQDELEVVGAVPLQLPSQQSPVANRLAELIEQSLGGPFRLEELIRKCGTSRRTMERLFRAETAMSLGQWVRRRKLLDALRRLAEGETCGSVAFRQGYNSPSAFIAMFKRELGATPGAYLGRHA